MALSRSRSLRFNSHATFGSFSVRHFPRVWHVSHSSSSVIQFRPNPLAWVNSVGCWQFMQYSRTPHPHARSTSETAIAHA